MFWKNKGAPDAKATDLHRAFEIAGEATRRATFLNVAGRMPQGGAVKQELALLFQVCRTKALEAGAAIGLSQAEVDAKIAALCDEDAARLKNSSDREFREFARDSAEIVKAFLATANKVG
jgi:hypothetical protein